MSLTDNEITATTGAASGTTTQSLSTASITSGTIGAGAMVLVRVVALFNNSSVSSTLSLADNHGNTYTSVLASASGFGVANYAIFAFTYSSAPGATTLTATSSASSTATGGCEFLISPTVITGQSGSFGANTINYAPTTSISSLTQSLTTTTAGSRVYLVGGAGNGSTITAGSNTTLTKYYAGYNGAASGLASSATGTPGATTLGFALSSSSAFGGNLLGVEVLPAAAAITATGQFELAPLAASGTASSSTPITATGSFALAPLAVSGLAGGTAGITATGQFELPSLALSGDAVAGAAITGSVPGGTLGTAGIVGASLVTTFGSGGAGQLRVRGEIVAEVTAPPPTGPLQPPVVNNWLSGDTLNAASLNTYARDTFTYLANPPLLRVQQDAQQKGIPAATWTVIDLQQVNEDTYSGWSPNWNVGNAYQAQAPGWYSLTLNVTADVPPGSLARVGFWYWSTANSVWVGPIEFGQQVVGPGASHWTWQAYDETYLQLDDLVLPVFYHQASVSVNTDLSSPSTFELAWISS